MGEVPLQGGRATGPWSPEEPVTMAPTVIIGGGRFLMSEVSLYSPKKTQPPWDPIVGLCLGS
jgi:hypothetical protein